jgi:hypothetical protein
MRIRFRAVILAATGLFVACDSSPVVVNSQPVVGPHRGTGIRLPDDKGLVELTNEPEVTDPRSNEATSVVAYFLQMDGKSALDPPPSDVNLVVQQGKASQTIPLVPEPKADDPASAGRFASKAGPFLLSRLRGNLTANIGGQKVTVSFS